MGQLLTMDEVAERLRTPISTLRFWRHCGTGPASFKIGRRVVYSEDAVTAFLMEQMAAGGGRPAA